jgi:photosystem II stability/assembly factor-like uncharacterized protein
MDTYAGRATASGAWVAVGPAGELHEHAERGEVIEVITTSGNVARVRIAHVGHAFDRGGVTLAYGYLEDADVMAGAL